MRRQQHAHGLPPAHAREREPGAGARRSGHRGHRRVLAGRAAVPAAHGPQPVPRRHDHRRRDRARDLRGAAASTERGRRGEPPRPPRRPRPHHAEGAPQGSRAALHVGRAAGAGRPAASRPPAGPGGARCLDISHAQVRGAAPGGRGGGGRGDAGAGGRRCRDLVAGEARGAPLQRRPPAGPHVHVRRPRRHREAARIHRDAQAARHRGARVSRQPRVGSGRGRITAARAGGRVREDGGRPRPAEHAEPGRPPGGADDVSQGAGGARASPGDGSRERRASTRPVDHVPEAGSCPPLHGRPARRRGGGGEVVGHRGSAGGGGQDAGPVVSPRQQLHDSRVSSLRRRPHGRQPRPPAKSDRAVRAAGGFRLEPGHGPTPAGAGLRLPGRGPGRLRARPRARSRPSGLLGDVPQGARAGGGPGPGRRVEHHPSAKGMGRVRASR